MAGILFVALGLLLVGIDRLLGRRLSISRPLVLDGFFRKDATCYMQTTGGLIAGLVISAIPVLFLTFDTAIKSDRRFRCC